MITAIVPARGGSKRLPGKNIKQLNGKPLVFHTIDALLDQEQVTEILFTTDSESYVALIEGEYGPKVRCILRPALYASDTTKVYEEVKRLHGAGELTTDWYMLCLPTCPLRGHGVVADLLREWEKDKVPVFTGVEYDFPVQFAFSLDDSGAWESIFSDSPMITGNTRSQDIPKKYRPNGAIYLQHVGNLTNKTLYMNAKVYKMSLLQSVDVDTELDFKLCELIMAETTYNE